MSNKLIVYWEVTSPEGKEIIDWSDINTTEEAFLELSQVEQEDLIQNYLDTLDRNAIILNRFHLKGSKQ